MEYNFVIIIWSVIFIAIALGMLIPLYIKCKRCSVCVNAKILNTSVDGIEDPDLHNGNYYNSVCEFNYNDKMYHVSSKFGGDLKNGDCEDIHINPNNPEEIVTKFMKKRTITLAIVFVICSLFPLILYKVLLNK